MPFENDTALVPHRCLPSVNDAQETIAFAIGRVAA